MESQIITSDVISLQGFEDSTDYQTAKEWREFTDNYDMDGALLKNADTDGFGGRLATIAYTFTWTK